MALNFPCESSFSTPPEKGLCPSIGPVVDGYLIKNYGCFGNSCSFCSFNGALEDNSCGEMVKAELGHFDDPAAVLVDDLLDRLPRDPFGMNVKSTFTAISDWIQDSEWDFRSEYDVFRIDETHTMIGDRQVFMGLNWGWNGARNFQPQGGNVKDNGISVLGDDLVGYQIFDGFYDGGVVADGNVGELMTTCHRSNWVSSCEAEELQNCTKIDFHGEVGVPHDAMFFMTTCQRGNWVSSNGAEELQNCAKIDFDGGGDVPHDAMFFMTTCQRANWVLSSEAEELQSYTKIDFDGEGGVPHDAMFLVLGYLGVQDLLSVEQVSKSFRDTVRGDPLLWRTIHIEQPLNVGITDGTLVKLTSRAQGTLQCLSLVNCFRITDGGLRRVLQNNPGLMKLSVPGCVRLTVDGILSNIRALKSLGTHGIKHLRIGGLGGLAGVTDQQFEELRDLLDADKYIQQRNQKPHFYRGRFSYITCEDDRAIDIEVCPKCREFRLVYDCPAESCQQKHQAAQLCRGCTICIARCIHCGRCIKDYEYEETFCLELLCLDCWKQLLNCPEKPVEKKAAKCTIINQSTMYRFCLYG